MAGEKELLVQCRPFHIFMANSGLSQHRWIMQNPSSASDVTFNYLCLQMLLSETAKEKSRDDGTWFLDQKIKHPGKKVWRFCWETLGFSLGWTPLGCLTQAWVWASSKEADRAACTELSLEFVTGLRSRELVSWASHPSSLSPSFLISVREGGGASSKQTA